MHPSIIAKETPEKAAIIMADSGIEISYAALDRQSNQIANLLRALDLQAGDVVATMLENRPEIFSVAWAAQRSGLYATLLSTRFVEDEVAYILADSGTKALVISSRFLNLAGNIQDRFPSLRIVMTDEVPHPFISLDAAIGSMPVTPIADETCGTDLLYSSGTTGRPKGIKPPLPGGPIDAPNQLAAIMENVFDQAKGMISLCPAPLYHAAPLRWFMSVQRLGGTVVVMENFDAEETLRLIERYRIQAGQFVPTHFSRLLKLPTEIRLRYDISSMRQAVHAAAPCPAGIKEAMIDWWGPIIHEYYSGTEGIGLCAIRAEEWLAHKGSVGRSVKGTLRICGADGEPLPARSEGLVYFEGGNSFAYHNDPEKTAASHNQYGWSTFGDIGWIDEEGYLYLTDRQSFMIISGGVNIYPQEIENILVTHPLVEDAAVIGAPDPDLGEKVLAVIQPREWADAGPSLAVELDKFVRARLSPVKAPKAFDFMQELPRQPTGKLYKRMVRDAYWTRQPDLH